MKTLKTKDILNSEKTLRIFHIIKTIMKNPNSTSTRVIKMTKIPPASVYRTIDMLTGAEIIYKSGKERNSLGPNSITYSTKYSLLRFEITKNGITVYVK